MDRYELYYNYAHSQIQEQNERIKAIQARVMNLMALNVALLGVFGLILPNITPWSGAFTDTFSGRFAGSSWGIRRVNLLFVEDIVPE